MSDAQHAQHAVHLTKHLLETQTGQAAVASATAGAIAAAPVVVPIAVTLGVAYGIFKLFEKLAE